MPLFADINDFKTHVGGSVAKTVQMASLEPFLVLAQNDYVLRKIGQETLTQLSAASATGVVAVAKGLMKSAVAWFGLYEYSTVGNVQFTEGGIQRAESEQLKSAFKYQEAAYRRSALKNGWSNVEQLLLLLLDMPNEFEKYHLSYEKEQNSQHLLNSTRDFARAQCRVPERYTFEAILPYIADVETFCITDFLGNALFSRLRDSQYTTPTPEMTPEAIVTLRKEAQLIAYLRKGIAEMTYHLATVGNLIEYQGSRVITRETYLTDDLNKTANPTMDVLSAAFNQRREWADRYFRLAENYIQSEAREFSEWIGFAEIATTQSSTQNNRLKSL